MGASHNDGGQEILILVCTVLGTMAFFAVLGLSLYSADSAVDVNEVVEKSFFLFSTGATFFYVIWNRIPRFTELVWNTKAYCLIVLALMLPLYCMVLCRSVLFGSISVPFVVVLACHVAAGISLGLLFLPWAIMWACVTNGIGVGSTRSEARVRYLRGFIGLVFGLLGAILLVLAITHYAYNAAPVALAHFLLFLLAIALGVICVNCIDRTAVSVEAPFRHVSDIGHEERFSSLFVPYAIGILLAGSITIDLLVGGARIPLLEGFVICVGFFLNIIGLFRVLNDRKLPTFYTSIKYLLLAQGIIVSLFAVLPEPLYVLSADLLLLENLFCVVVGLGTSFLSSAKAELSPLFFTLRSLYRMFLGAAIGGLLAFAIMHSSSGFQSAQLFWTFYMLLVVVSIYSFTHSIEDLSDDIVADAGNPAQDTLSDYGNASEHDALFSGSSEGGGWPREGYSRLRERCLAIAEENRLTQRETEIFVMLAKGRNVHFIAENLVISVNTVKTHVYRIYKKLDIQSRQDLISLIEQE